MLITDREVFKVLSREGSRKKNVDKLAGHKNLSLKLQEMTTTSMLLKASSRVLFPDGDAHSLQPITGGRGPKT